MLLSRLTLWIAALALAAAFPSALPAADIVLLQARPDPFGWPRPAPGAEQVPLSTSLFFQLGFRDREASDRVLADSVSVRVLGPEGTSAVEVLAAGQQFAPGFQGQLQPSRKPEGALAVYIDGPFAWQPRTRYTIEVRARSLAGAELQGAPGAWSFTTADAPGRPTIEFQVDLAQPAVAWQGGFFTGFCKPSFCTSASNRLPGYELMLGVRQSSPRAWSLQRDFSLTGAQHQPQFLDGGQPNLVRERETRRIRAMEPHENGTLLRVEDFFGHEQYGIESNRPLAGDYHAGDEVLVADGVSDARAKVLRVVSDTPAERWLLVTRIEPPAGGWKLEYARPLPQQEDPHAPGLFPPGGCYLRKFLPAGTPHYYWGRVDREWDIATRYGRRLVVNFTDAPGDLAVDGRQWTYPKDYVEYHQVVREITSHLIQRYGEACLDFVWSVLNEPDLAVAFWRSRDWDELQKFYDYTVDAILRSFEDHGYDSRRVVVGGLEIGAIFGARIEGPILKKFLIHCSPTATGEGALELNAAFADRRLDGKRSQRVERLCGEHGGRGSPCDFISIHGYNAAEVLAAKLHRGKQLALEIDPEYYAQLWVNSFESCPDWAPPPDPAAADSYLGNGYFTTWCADVARRRLAAAAADPRYGFGEATLTFWPWPNKNLRGHNNATQVLSVDDDADGQPDRELTVALPILHYLGLLEQMRDRFWVLPEQRMAGHLVSGFASRADDRLCLLLYAHDPLDVQSRTAAEFQVRAELNALPWAEVEIEEYRYDQRHNSYYELARRLRDQPPDAAASARLPAEDVPRLVAILTGNDREAQLAAIQQLTRYRDVPEPVLVAALQLHQATTHEDIRLAIEEAGKKVMNRQASFTPADAERIEQASRQQVTDRRRAKAGADGSLRLTVPVSANGSTFVVLRPVRN